MRTHLLPLLAAFALSAGVAQGACKDHARDPTFVELAVPEGAPRPANVEAFAFIDDATTMQMVVDKVGPPHASSGERPPKLIWCLPDGSEVAVVTPDGTKILQVRHGGKLLYKRKKK